MRALRTLRAVRAVFLALIVAAVPAGSFAAVSVSITIAPPLLPAYDQPVCPGDGYMWTPGYWAWGPAGYYWVPGVWIQPPAVGLLWTPGYWSFGGGGYLWHAGYWGPRVGFYGGVHYGFGYDGTGFFGGRWQGSRFYYNTAVTNVNRNIIRNTYVNRSVVRNTTVNRASFNGRGGIDARPTSQQEAAARQRRFGPTPTQLSHRSNASRDRGNFVSENRGRPATPAMSRPVNRPASRPEFNSQGPENRGQVNNSQRPQSREPISRPGQPGSRGADVNREPRTAPQARPAQRPDNGGKQSERRDQDRRQGPGQGTGQGSGQGSGQGPR